MNLIQYLGLAVTALAVIGIVVSLLDWCRKDENDR